MITSKKIVKQVMKLMAHGGLSGVTMRSLAKEVQISPSVLYHYFPTKSLLLRAMFDETNRELGKRRSQLIPPKTAKNMLRQRIEFQFDNADLVVSVLKFYFSYRKEFPNLRPGFLPEKTYLHIKEVLEYGISTGEFENKDIDKQSRVIVHAINGYLLEYYPHIPKGEDREHVITELNEFLFRGILKSKSNLQQ